MRGVLDMYMHLLYGRDGIGADGLIKHAQVMSIESGLSNTDRNLESMLASTSIMPYEAASLSLRSGSCN